uniref:NB-ARC domain-containing protein n=1 Tax=Manihot esculenta TaxID=3983 RepID=A0A2C9UMQ5_MANES
MEYFLCRDESEFIHEIVKDIISKLGRFSKDITKGLVGMELRLEKMRSYLDIKQSDEVKIIGVWGMGGIGKTTIASVVYKQMYSQFEESSFLADIREASKRHDGLVSLQNKLLSAILNRDVKVHDVHRGIDEIRKRLRHKKVLLILDDVDELVQLEYLIGKRDENWFCKESRIIITTRNKHLLVQHGVDNTYMLEELDGHEALELFYLKAFKTDCPTRNYVELSDHVLRCASGLPLALSVLGSYLFSKSIKVWKSALERLKEIPNEEILGRLQISFDGLDEIDKKYFLERMKIM